jgi:hypothetical protein
VQLGNIIGTFIYLADDAPLYRRGNRNLVAINVLAIVLFILTKIYYVTKNRVRDKKWNALTAEVREY